MHKPNKADLLIYKALCKALEQNLLKIYLDTSKLNRPNSPVYNPWENLLPLLIPMLIGLALILSVSCFIGLAFIIATTMAYSYYFKQFIVKKLLDRTKHYLSTDFAHCQELWDFGGIVFTTSDNKKIGCISPTGDWKEFIVLNFSDLMVEKKAETTTETELKSDEQQSAA